MSNKNLKAQKTRVEEELEQMHLWYLSENGGRPAECIRQVKKPYRAKIFWWLAPILPGRENPVLIEEQLGDYWTLRLEPLTDEIRKLIGE